MKQEITQQTIEMAKRAFDPSDELHKAITTATGLTGYSLEAPAKKLFPRRAPLRNRIPRMAARAGAEAVNWKAITGINTANVKASVTFGQRNNEISYTTVPRNAKYKTLGLDDSVQDESVWMGRGFEDVRALSAMATLTSVMIEEEKLILGGNPSAADGGVALGTAPTPSLDTTEAGGVSADSDLRVVALTLYGYLNRTTDANGVATAIPTTSEHSKPSAVANTGAIASKKIKATWTAVPGAVAYAVYAGAAGGTLYLQNVVTANYWDSGTGALTTTGQQLSALTDADVSTDDNDFAGILPQLFVSGSGAYVLSLDNAGLTADGAGGISEFDAVFKQLWDEYGISPTLALMNSREAANITKKIMGSGSTPLQYRVNLTDGDKDVTGSLFVSGIVNKFTSGAAPGTPDVVPFMIHPYSPPGLITFLAEELPYPDAEVEHVVEMDVLQEYAQFEWARTQRKYEHGVYVNETLKMYFPSGCALLYCIGDS